MTQSLPDKRLAVLSFALVAAYTIRVTIPVVWIYPLAPYLINYSGFAVLIFALFYLLLQPVTHFNLFGMLLLIAVAVTALFSVDLETALIRSILWGLVFIVTGPVFTGLRANTFRNYLWNQSKNLIIAITLLSFVWNSLHLPQYGKGTAGVTMHCMLLGAISGLASVFSFSNLLALTSRSLIRWGIFTASALTCFLSGSRSAVMAAAVGCAIVLIMKSQNVILRLICIIGIIMITTFVWSAFDLGGSDLETINASKSILNPYTKEIFQKGKINTRQQLWANRVEEFLESPASGVGIGVDTFASVKKSIGGNVIEPGSSYLAVLSMTGILGAMGLLLLLCSLGGQMVKRSYLIPKTDLVQAASVGAFWAVHAVAEGWIFAGGSLLCLLFWIWVGRLANLAGTVPENQTGLL